MTFTTLQKGPDVRKAGHVLALVLLIALVAPFVVYAVPQVVGADHGYVVLSGSMEPAISPGDAVIVREVQPSEIERNDVITFQTGTNEPPTTHRVVRVVETENGVAFKTKGDANEDPDRGFVRSENVVGELAFVIPYLGYVVQFANSSTGFALLVIVPLTLFVLSELWELIASTQSGGDPDADSTAATDAASTSPNAAAAATNGAGAATHGATETTADESGSGGSFVVTRSSLLLLLALLVVYVPYSGYVAFRVREVWAFTVASGSAFAFLFVLGLYVLGDTAGGDDGDAARSAGDALVRPGRLPPSTDDRTYVPVSSVGSLVEMATDSDDWVVFDSDRETYFLPNGDALYLCPADGEWSDRTPEAASGEEGAA